MPPAPGDVPTLALGINPPHAIYTKRKTKTYIYQNIYVCVNRWVGGSAPPHVEGLLKRTIIVDITIPHLAGPGRWGGIDTRGPAPLNISEAKLALTV